MEDFFEKIRPHYRSGKNDLSKEFFSPCLSHCDSYKRAAGFFSSSALVSWKDSLPVLVEGDCKKVKLLISPLISQQDIAAIRKVTTERSKMTFLLAKKDEVLEALTSWLAEDYKNDYQRLLFAWMIANGALEIKFAFPNHVDDEGIFHEKYGIFSFANQSKIAFTGSANETLHGHQKNYESIDVYKSSIVYDIDRISVKEEQFDEAWAGNQKGLNVVDIDDETLKRISDLAPKLKPKLSAKCDPVKVVDKWEHQREAENAFFGNKAGVVEMATGTGKTRTALNIAARLLSEERIYGVIVSTEGTDLLNQWVSEVYDWMTREGLSFPIFRHFNIHHDIGEYVIDPDSAIMVISRNALGSLLNNLTDSQKKQLFIIHDEVHGFGVPSLRDSIEGKHAGFIYKLGLSATPEREYDDEGTQFIENEIGPVIYQFTLEDAIRKGILCGFNYIPLYYPLTEGDRERVSMVYKKRAARQREGRPMSQEEVWTDISKVYKTAELKPNVFMEYIGNNKTVLSRCIIFVETKEYAEPILEMIHRYTYSYRTYYSGEDSNHLAEFAKGNVDCLITCHRLSQGIDIRDLENVVLFSSARAKLETIQRIGRVLRIDPNKPEKKANIIDFIRISDDGQGNTDSYRDEWLSGLSKIECGGDSCAT